MARGLAALVGLAVASSGSDAVACGCCDGASLVDVVGWDVAQPALLLDRTVTRGCERRVTFGIVPVGSAEAVQCYDRLADPSRLVSCEAAVVGFDEPSSAGPPTAYRTPARAVAHDSVRVVYHATGDGAFSRAVVSVQLFLGEFRTVDEFVVYEYWEPRFEAESELVPIEVAVVPVPGRVGEFAILVRGYDDNPGIGHRAFSLHWASLPGTPPLPTHALAWQRGVPLPGGIVHEPQAASLHYGHGLAAHAKGAYVAAIEHFGRALQRDANHTLARYNLACAEARAGFAERALETLTELFSNNLSASQRTEREERMRSDPDLAAVRRLPAFSLRFPTR